VENTEALAADEARRKLALARETLIIAKGTINNNPAVVDTIWISMAQTLVDVIDETLLQTK